jgi:hypothetical protein
MVDDAAMVAELLPKMEAQLPIPAFPSSRLVRLLRQQGSHSSTSRPLSIKSLAYAGDEGGIMCDVTPDPGAKAVHVVSLTHLRVPPDHPLAQEISAYQRRRVERLPKE